MSNFVLAWPNTASHQSGKCDVLVGDVSVAEKDGSGENNFVGELALLYHAPRSATIIAKGEVTSWSLDRTTFKTILQDANLQKGDKHTAFLDQVRSELLCISLPRLVATRLRTPRRTSPEDYGSLQMTNHVSPLAKVPILNSLSKLDKQQLADALTAVEYSAGDLIIKEGDVSLAHALST